MWAKALAEFPREGGGGGGEGEWQPVVSLVLFSCEKCLFLSPYPGDGRCSENHH